VRGLETPVPVLASFVAVPTYEYKCPNGHVFEIFKRISEPAPEACPVCSASPVQTVLYPVPVHFRGSGFYSTDYGRGGRKQSKDGDGADKEKKADKADKPEKKEKAAEA
jgi:putative FmdB family regulatory protein